MTMALPQIFGVQIKRRDALPYASSELENESGSLYGRIEKVFEGAIVGWTFVRDRGPIYITCTFDGVAVGGTIANTSRTDVAASARYAPANCGFHLQLDVKALLTKCDNFDELQERLCLEINDQAQLSYMCEDPYKAFFRSTSDVKVRGHLDNLTRGQLTGWCVEEGVEIPTSIHVLIDGILQADIECSEHRSDLADLLGIDHGGFTFDVPRKFHDGRMHVIRCIIPSNRLELLGSPLDFRFVAEEDVIRAEVHTFATALERLEGDLAEAKRAFEQYTLKKGAFLANYRYLWPTISLGDITRSKLMRIARETATEEIITIVLPTFRSDRALLEAAIDSVVAQTDPHWELVITDSASVEGQLKAFLTARAAMDSRIKLVFNSRQLGIAENTNQGLKLATGSIVGFLDHDDTLAPEAVSLMRQSFATNEYDLIYSDEDKINFRGEYVDPHYKSAMNFDLLLSMNYMCHFVCIRRSVLEQTRGPRREYEGAQDWDLILQVLGKIGCKRVGHIPRVLYHWRMTPSSTATASSAKSHAVAAGIAAVNAFLGANKHDAKAVKAAGHLPYAEVNWQPSKTAQLSIVIPTRDKLELVMHCISSLEATIGSVDYEIILVDNLSSLRSARGFEKVAANNPRVRIIKYGGDFNYSAINNYAVKQANFSNILFLNNDVFFVENDWCKKMLGLLSRRDVGVVGLKLMYPDGTVQHCGVVLGNGGVAGHAFSHLDEDDTGYFARAAVDQQVSAVTGACMMLRKSVFEDIGGFETEGLSIAFNDVDLCMRIAEQGYSNILVASRFAYHAESKSRGAEDTPEKIARFGLEVAFMKKRWMEKLGKDCFYSPNLALMHAPFQRIDIDQIIAQEFSLSNGPLAR